MESINLPREQGIEALAFPFNGCGCHYNVNMPLPLTTLRVLLAALLLLLVSPLTFGQAPDAPLTAEDAMRRILQATGATPPHDTVDTVKAGDPKTVVTGIATTFMDTYPVLEQAVADGKNLIVTHEPTFYNHLDNLATLAADSVQAKKLAYINEHHLVVWRFHDTWHDRKPDGILEGVVDELGWKQYQSSADPQLFVLPPTSVAQLAAALQTTTGSRSIRIVGDTAMTVTRIALMPGAAGLVEQVKMLERDDVQALVAGESAEWEGVEYAQDAAAEGRHKVLILLGHQASEEAGMRSCAPWIRTVLPGVPVEFIPAGEPFQTPRSLRAHKP